MATSERKTVANPNGVIATSYYIMNRLLFGKPSQPAYQVQEIRDIENNKLQYNVAPISAISTQQHIATTTEASMDKNERGRANPNVTTTTTTTTRREYFKLQFWMPRANAPLITSLDPTADSQSAKAASNSPFSPSGFGVPVGGAALPGAAAAGTTAAGSRAVTDSMFDYTTTRCIVQQLLCLLIPLLLIIIVVLINEWPRGQEPSIIILDNENATNSSNTTKLSFYPGGNHTTGHIEGGAADAHDTLQDDTAANNPSYDPLEHFKQKLKTDESLRHLWWQAHANLLNTIPLPESGVAGSPPSAETANETEEQQIADAMPNFANSPALLKAADESLFPEAAVNVNANSAANNGGVVQRQESAQPVAVTSNLSLLARASKAFLAEHRQRQQRMGNSWRDVEPV